MTEEEKRLIQEFKTKNSDLDFEGISDEELLKELKPATQQTQKQQALPAQNVNQQPPQEEMSGTEAFFRGIPRGSSFGFIDELGLENMQKRAQAEEEQGMPYLGGQITGSAITSLGLAALVEALTRGRAKGKILAPALARYIAANPKLAPALGQLAQSFAEGVGESQEGERTIGGLTNVATTAGLGATFNLAGMATKKMFNPKTWQDISDYFRYKSLGGPAGTPTRTTAESITRKGETPKEVMSRIANLTREYPELMPDENRYEAINKVLDIFNQNKQKLFETAKEKGINIPYSELNKLPREAMSELGYLSPKGKPLSSFGTQMRELGTIQKDIKQYKPAQVYTNKKGEVVPSVSIEDADKFRQQIGKKTFDYASGTSDPYSNIYGKSRNLIESTLESKQPGLGKSYDETLRNINTLNAIKDITNEAQSRSIANNTIGLGTSSTAALFPEQGNLGRLQAVTGVLGLKRYGAQLGYPVTEAIGGALETVTKPITSDYGQQIIGGINKYGIPREVKRATARNIGPAIQ